MYKLTYLLTYLLNCDHNLPKIFDGCQSDSFSYRQQYSFIHNNVMFVQKSKDWAAEVLTEDVDVAVCKYVSVIVARLALNHHQITLTATVGLTYWRYCQRLSVAGKLELYRWRVSCLHIHNVIHEQVLKPQDRDGVLAKFVKDDVTRQLCFYDTTWYDKLGLGLYLCAPKSWRTASLVCRTEPTTKKRNEEN